MADKGKTRANTPGTDADTVGGNLHAPAVFLTGFPSAAGSCRTTATAAADGKALPYPSILHI